MARPETKNRHRQTSQRQLLMRELIVGCVAYGFGALQRAQCTPRSTRTTSLVEWGVMGVPWVVVAPNAYFCLIIGRKYALNRCKWGKGWEGGGKGVGRG